jgi:phenylalanyl-tRNA synthetase beta chain
VKLNQARKTGATRFFECGRIFREVDGVVYELASVAFVMINDPRQRTWRTREKADFFLSRRHVEVLARMAGIDLAAEEFRPVTGTNSAWQEGHSAAAGDLSRGFEVRMGLLSPFLLKANDIEGEAVAGVFEVLPEHFEKATGETLRFKPFSLFPAAERDLALVIPQEVPAERARRDLQSAAEKAVGGKFAVEKVEPFDVYQGKGLPEGHKSVAFALTFRATDRTLTDEEVNQVFGAVQKAITTETEFAIRQ